MSEPLSIGMLGYGFMGDAHANALARLPMFFPDAPATERTVLIGRDPDGVATAADRLGFESHATSWEDVVHTVDILYNLGPNHLHVEPSVAALAADTHVFCEKPLAHTVGGAERMKAAADDSAALGGVAFNYRYVPAIQYARQLIDDGVIGDIRHFRGRYLQDWLVDPTEPWSWRNDRDLAGSGALGDLGAHTIDLARFLVGPQAGPITKVTGQTSTFAEERPLEDDPAKSRPVTVDDAYSALATFANGTTATFEASRVATGAKNDHTIEINGTRGSIQFSLERLNELSVLGPDSRGFETILVTDDTDPYIDHWWPPGHVIGWEHTFVHENYEFLMAVAHEKPYEPTFTDGLRVQRLLAAIETAATEGTWIDV